MKNARLLDRLAREKLADEARIVRTERWKWIEAAIDFPYGHTAGMTRLKGRTVEMTEEEEAAYQALRAEQEKLEAAYAEADEFPEDVDQRLGEIETSLTSFEQRPVVYEPADVARAGVFVSIAGDGSLRIERGYVHPDDAPDPQPLRPNGQAPAGFAPPDEAIVVHGADAVESEAPRETADARLSDRLVGELTAHRTLALRDALGGSPDTALLAVLHALTLACFYPCPTASCLEISALTKRLDVQAPGLAESASAKSIDARHAHWRERLPDSTERLWETLDAFEAKDRLDLFAHCAALTINAVSEPWARRSARMAHADALARAVRLDMAEAGWRPTVDNYLGRVPKARILAAVREAKGENAAQLIDHLKRSDMAKEAERLLADTGWLPEPLRTSDPDADDSGSVESDAAALPAFLDGDGEEDEEEPPAAASAA